MVLISFDHSANKIYRSGSRRSTDCEEMDSDWQYTPTEDAFSRLLRRIYFRFRFSLLLSSTHICFVISKGMSLSITVLLSKIGIDSEPSILDVVKLSGELVNWVSLQNSRLYSTSSYYLGW